MKNYRLSGSWAFSLLVLLNVTFGGAALAQYSQELGKLAPEALKPAQYKHFRNYHRMRGWVYALHHLLVTGKPMAPFP